MFVPRLLARTLKASSPPFFLKYTQPIQSTRLFSASAVNMVTVSEAITHDHRELEEYSNNILNATDADSKVRWQNQFIWELARHSIAEELVVYPAMERSVPNGKEAADKDRKEHLVVKEGLYKFQGMKPEDANFESTLKDLMSNLRQHIQEEEKDDLPALEKALESSESEKLARSFARTKKFVPTRSHPSAPDKPPFETVAGLLAAPIDHLMDLFKKFPEESKTQLPP